MYNIRIVYNDQGVIDGLPMKERFDPNKGCKEHHLAKSVAVHRISKK